jgi:hypothetical protein
VTTRDPSQIPIEQLAQLLLQCARTDVALPLRSPANDDPLHAVYIDEVYNHLEALPELRREPAAVRPALDPSWPAVPDRKPASNTDLEELVAVALTSAQDAADLARDAHDASLTARRGMYAAVGLAAIGLAIAAGASIGARLYHSGNSQTAEIPRQVQELGSLQRHINDPLAELHAAAPVQQASTEPIAAVPPNNIAPPLLAPLKAVPVRVLPAEAAAPQTAAAAVGPSRRTEAQAASYAPAAPAAAYPPAPHSTAHAPQVVYRRTWTPYHPSPRHYRAAVLPPPVGYFISAVQRDVRALLR